MKLEYLITLTILISIIVFLIQRTESGKRLIVILTMIIPAVLIRNYAVYRDAQTEGWVALGIALVLNFFFWVLIGRYNPVASSDEIRVLGMDD